MEQPQQKYIEESFTRFAKTLSKEQAEVLYFRLDDLIQYGREAVYVAYKAISICKEGR